MDTVGDLYNRDFRVVIHKKGVADFDAKAYNFSLKRMEKIYGAELRLKSVIFQTGGNIR